MNYGILFLIGRILYGGYFFMAGLNHFMKFGMMSGYAKSKGVPVAKLAIVASGLLVLFGGLGVLAGAYVGWSVLFIVVFLIPVSFKMHAFWKDQDPNAKMADMQHFQKNMALLGAALIILAVPGPWIYPIF